MLYIIFFINYADGKNQFNSDHTYTSEKFPNRKEFIDDIVTHYKKNNNVVLQPECIAITGFERLTKEEFDLWIGN